MKLKLDNNQLYGLASRLRGYLDQEEYLIWTDTDVDNLLRATLEELELKLKQVSIIRKTKYRITLKPTWAFAIRVAFAGRVDVTTYEGNILMQICNSAHQAYA